LELVTGAAKVIDPVPLAEPEGIKEAIIYP
jgi:hypothetical protein